MKNKNFTRFLCFFMCFCLCFAWFGPPIEAKAVAIELGWVTYVIISVMAAMGITATVSGGIDALKNAVEDGFDEWAGDQKQAKITQISDYISYYEPPSGDGFDPDDLVKKLLIGAGAFTVIKDFIDWLSTDGGWSKGEDIEYLIDEISFYSSNDLVSYTNIKIGTLKNWDSSTKTGDIDVAPTWVEANADVYSSDMQLIFYSPDGYNGGKFEFYYEPSGFANYGIWGWSHESYAGTNFTSIAGNQLGNYNKNDIVSYGIFVDPNYTNSRLMICGLLSSGQVICLIDGIYKSVSSLNENEQNCIVTVPAEITEYEVTDYQQMEIGFRGISGSFSTPEEFSEAIKTTIVDTGVLPDVEPTVTEVTEPDPEPVPTPDVESDGTLESNVSGILEWIKAIFNAILSLPKAIADLILEGIKAIFVPDPEVIQAEFMDLLEEINDKYLFDFDLDLLFGSSKEPDDITAVYAIGNHRWNLTFVSWYYLKKAVEFFRPYIRGFIVLMLIFYNLRQFMSIFGLGGVMNGDSADRRVNDLAV